MQSGTFSPSIILAEALVHRDPHHCAVCVRWNILRVNDHVRQHDFLFGTHWPSATSGDCSIWMGRPSNANMYVEQLHTLQAESLHSFQRRCQRSCCISNMQKWLSYFKWKTKSEEINFEASSFFNKQTFFRVYSQGQEYYWPTALHPSLFYLDKLKIKTHVFPKKKKKDQVTKPIHSF